MKLIDDVGFDQSFSFIFSKRPGTPAANLPDDTPDAIKHARLVRLQADDQRKRQGDLAGDDRQRAARARRRPEQEESERTDRPHREHALT